MNDKDQAENLRIKATGQTYVNDELSDTYNETNKESKIDILNLPKRSDIHDKKNKKASLKFNKTFFRFLMVVIFILAILGFGFYLKYMNH